MVKTIILMAQTLIIKRVAILIISRESRKPFSVGGTTISKPCRDCQTCRLAPGCKADFVSVDVKDPSMMPLREPLRSLIFVAADRAVRDVYVDGEQVVADGKVLNIDLQASSEALEAAQQRSMAQVPDRDWAGRSAEELAPMVLPTAESLTQA